MASVSPSSTASTAYKVTNTVARACPTINSEWKGLETLPPTPNSTLCNCMFASLSCTTKPDFEATPVAFTVGNQICYSNPSNCFGINQNVTTGTYGAYSACNNSQQLSWIMNHDYLSNKSTSPNCDYSGWGQLKPVSPAVPQCQKLLDQAGPQGTGIVTTNTDTDQGRSRGLSSGAKAGIAIAVAFVCILVGVGVFICVKRTMAKKAPIPVEGGLEVGEAPPEFSALRRAELETNDIGNPSIRQREFGGNEPAVHDNPFEGNEVRASERRQESDNTGVSPRPEYSELDGKAEIPELDGPNPLARGEVSGDSMMLFEHSPPNRKSLPGSTAPQLGQTTSKSPASVSHLNSPWSSPGIEDLKSEEALGARPGKAANAAEMRRIEEEERRLDEAIAESEKLQALRRQKEELQKRKLDMQAKAGERSFTTPI
jgi:hypothetical protein